MYNFSNKSCVISCKFWTIVIQLVAFPKNIASFFALTRLIIHTNSEFFKSYLEYKIINLYKVYWCIRMY